MKSPNTVDSIRRKVCENTLRSIEKNTAFSEYGEKHLDAQNKKIEKSRKAYLRRHASLTRVIEKDLQDLRTAQKRYDEERKRRISCCTPISSAKADKRSNSNGKCGLKFSYQTTRQDMLLVDYRTQSYSTGTRSSLKDLTVSPIDSHKYTNTNLGMNLSPVSGSMKFSSNIRI